jgi:hypothetical protein
VNRRGISGTHHTQFFLMQAAWMAEAECAGRGGGDCDSTLAVQVAAASLKPNLLLRKAARIPAIGRATPSLPTLVNTYNGSASEHVVVEEGADGSFYVKVRRAVGRGGRGGHLGCIGCQQS